MLRVFVSVIFLLCLNGCNPTKPKNFGSKHVYMQAKSTDVKSDKVTMLRVQALRDTALSLGARGGLAERSKQLNQLLVHHEKVLPRIFHFYGMILDNNVLPPVLHEAQKSLQLSGNDVIRIADRNYRIIQQARFVTAPPTWRDYLWMQFTAPDIPDKSLLPKNKAEHIIWQKYIEEGWQAGLQQADSIFTENINRIKRDYLGMILYRRLLAKNMVSPPYVASMDLGITGNKDNLYVNDRVFKITAFPALQTDGQQWKTEIVSHEN